MINKIIRGVLTLLGTFLGFGIVTLIDSLGLLYFMDSKIKFYSLIGVSIILGIIFLIFSTTIINIGRKMVEKVESRLQETPASDIILGTVGLVVGLVIAYLVSNLLLQIPYVGWVLSILFYLLLAYLGIILQGPYKGPLHQ